MRLSEIMADAGANGRYAVDIAGITADSRAVESGYLFAALPGSHADGQQFIGDALRRGAVAILTGSDCHLHDDLPVPVIIDPNPRRRLALMASKFYGKQPRHLVAVTGTSGKTSVVNFTQQIWQALGFESASLGTLGIVTRNGTRKGALTTPDPVSLHRDLDDLAAASVTHAALEASSHGLDQYRLDGLRLRAAAFTNLSHDHLDYHASMAAYKTAKLRLFGEILPAGALAVLNADSPDFADFAAVCRARDIAVISYGAAGEDLKLLSVDSQLAGLRLTVNAKGKTRQIECDLFGDFQAHNLLCAVGLAVACGAPVDNALAASGQVTPIPGRLELVAVHPSGAPILVDYAHKPDALETVLRSVRPAVRGKLVLVFGCGGDRDRGKRPMMGAIAARLADRVFVTDDNPRSEDPGDIRAAILAECPGAHEIADRAAAIETAIAGLKEGDVLIIAGKGHETGQIVGDRVLPFSDKETAQRIVAKIKGDMS